MKRCPHCNSVYTDVTLAFCLQDGTPLVDDALPHYPQNAPTLTIPARATDEEVKLHEALKQARHGDIVIRLMVDRASREGTELPIFQQALHQVVDEVISEAQILSNFQSNEIDRSIPPSIFVIFNKENCYHKAWGELTESSIEDGDIQSIIFTVCGRKKIIDIIDDKRPRVYSKQPLELPYCLYCKNNQMEPTFKGK